MSSAGDIFSLRLVIAEFYMEKPVQGLDICYSEFRGKEIKRVPIIRIFGSNAQGQKTCMHVHGVFPYFYIPYDQKDFESLNQAIYQIALNIDKAINISLNQGSSSAQHVFKVQLVKGIPFYGYHRSEHLFLKIYMFNPRFVRRAANLLQNGAILNKSFHPHESHVPYILQFMIDYNLYGMSFLHVPLDIVKFRRSDDSTKVNLKNLQETQILDVNVVKKISSTSLEVDISSNFILNRFQLMAKRNATHANPGIQGIWNDERLRRQKLTECMADDEEKLNEIPPLEITSTQKRVDVHPAESETFYRTALLSKLSEMETSLTETIQVSNQTLNSSNISNTTSHSAHSNLNKLQKRRFNLSKLLQNFVYPEECTQNDNLVNASFIPNHLSSNIFELSSLMDSNEKKDNKEQNESIIMDETIVNEELVLSLTQCQHNKLEEHVPLNATLREEDIELLDILQQLEESNEDKIDLDSTLAPLSQNHKKFTISPEELDKEITAAALHQPIAGSDSEDENESDENLHDFSITLENLDDLILKLTQSQNETCSPNQKSDVYVPQVDGADEMLKTPTKNLKKVTEKSSPSTPSSRHRRSTMASPGRSPRTPKTVHKYAPLPLVSLNRSDNKTMAISNGNEMTSHQGKSVNRNSLPIYNLQKNFDDLRRKSISVDADVEQHVTTLKRNTSRRRSKRLVNLDKTYITCSLTPRRTNEKMLKMYKVEGPFNRDEKINNNEDVIELSLKKNQENQETLNKHESKKNENKFKNTYNFRDRSLSSNNKNNDLVKTAVKSTKVKTSAKNEEHLPLNTITSENHGEQKQILEHICKIDYKNTTGNDIEKCEKSLSYPETDEEINYSDNDDKLSMKTIRKTRNLKRLRRNFISTNTTKRRKINNHNFNSRCLDAETNKASSFKLKKCKIKLRKIESIIKNVNNITKNVDKDKVIKSPPKNAKLKTPEEFGTADLKLAKSLAEGIQPSKHSLDEKTNLSDDYNNFISENNEQKTSSDLQSLQNILSFKAPTSSPSIISDKPPNNLHAQKDYLEKRQAKSEQNILQKLENFQKALNLHLKSAETSKESIHDVGTSTSFDVSSDSLNKESSEEEITETPPECNKSLGSKKLSNKSLALESPILFTQNSSPVLLDNGELKKSKTSSRTNSSQSEIHITLSSLSNDSVPAPETTLILTPLDLPPSREDVVKGCHKLQLPEYEFQQPFYSNPDDITKHKELGFTVLQIRGNKLNDLEEFQSIMGTDFKGLAAWRREQLIRLGGVEMLNRYRNTQRIREYFSNQKSIIITPQTSAPTRQEAKLWLKARELLKTKEDDLEELKKKNLEEDSPIKVRRQKVTMMLNAGDGDSDIDDANKSVTLTPLTPATPALKPKENFTPVTRKSNSTACKLSISIKKRKNYRILKRVSLNKKFKETSDNESHYNHKQSSERSSVVKDSQESEMRRSLYDTASQQNSVASSQKSETSVSSETALAALQKSSFLFGLKDSDVTIGGFTENSTLNNTFGFKVSLENLQQAKADIELNHLTIIALEIFVATREDLYPNPELDEIRCLFYAIENSVSNEGLDDGVNLPRKASGYIMVHDHRDVVREGRIHGIDTDIEVTIVQTEVEALEALVGLCSRWDPDIYAGYEIEMASWGFVIERAKYLCLNIAPLLSRVPTQKVRDFVDEDRESFTDLDVEMKLCGRILLDVWRLLRSEIALTSYTFENVMYHIMHKRCPWHSYRNLSEWFNSPCSRWIVIEYYLERVRGTLTLLDQLDLIGRTSEMAKLIGIQFYEVLSRGSQFRVESMMLRIAKPKNLVPLSPSVQQRAHMRAPEYLPLIMEPQSRFYADPLIVLDFQSLYPSMIIAYNYCFSTCLGRVEHLGQSAPFEFGASQLRVSPAMLRKLVERDLISISPCGVVFVKSSVREGMLPRMLTEILDTRQMVKQSMKLHKTNSALQRILHSRQLGLKLMANVTYGYTAANFSGRMPAVEVGDSVVSKGRETLERAIKMIEANDKWNVRVVYGDTDSMFVLVPGRNRDEAFRIGEEIAEAVTQQNPHPVKLKLEKVYQPCILQTKKRYVGYMYETVDQKEPVYEAKGIETVRRDGCPMVAKMLEKVLRILFESADVSQVKRYVCRQFTKLLSGRANLQDLIFAKEFRGLNGYRPTACVPALELTRKWIQTDPRRIPRRGERVPFIVTNGPPGVPLIRLVRHPHEVLADEGLKINAIYYITKAIIPPLNRCLLLIGADVSEWFANLPRKILLTPAISTNTENISCLNLKSKKTTISQFFSTTNCVADCGRQTKQGICPECSHNSTRSIIILQLKISKLERSYLTTQHICQACCGRVGDLRCGSLDCPVLFVLECKRRDLQQISHFRNLIKERF